MQRSTRPLALALGGVLLLAACREDITGGSACPGLCPEQSVGMVDTVIYPVVLDSTLTGYPPLGAASQLLVARRGSALVTGAVLRFDSLTNRFPKSSTDTTSRFVTGVDSASLSLSVGAQVIPPAPVTIEVYDADVDAPDLDTAAVAAALRSRSPVATLGFAAKDTISGELTIPLPADFVEARVVGRRRIRLGVLVRSDSAISLTFGAADAGAATRLTYGARLDSATVIETRVAVNSVGDNDADAGVPGLADYMLILDGTPPPPPQALAVGGLPASRVYLRFDLPPGVVDTTTVVRATLILTQRPSPGLFARDTIGIAPRSVAAAPSVDVGKAALLLAPAAAFNIAPILLTPQDSGQRRFDIVNLVQAWKVTDSTRVQRAIVLQAGQEGLAPQQAWFYSTEAAVDSLRPRLRLTYIPSARFGLP